MCAYHFRVLRARIQKLDVCQSQRWQYKRSNKKVWWTKHTYKNNKNVKHLETITKSIVE